MKEIELVWAEHRAKLLSFIKSRVPHDDAEDILSEVQLKVISKMDTLSDDKRLSSWIYQVTRNTIVDYYRSRKVFDLLSNDLAEEVPDERVEDEIIECLMPMIEALSDKYKNAILISDINGRSQQELPDMEGISLSGAKSRVQRGRLELKKVLYECCEFELNHKNQVIDCKVKKSSKGPCT